MSKKANSCRHFEILAAAVAGGKSIRSAAELCGCSERQGYRISSTSEFRLRVAELRSEMISLSVGKISAATTQAVDRLIELLADPQHGLAAAKAILSHVAPLSELGELRGRLDLLEQR